MHHVRLRRTIRRFSRALSAVALALTLMTVLGAPPPAPNPAEDHAAHPVPLVNWNSLGARRSRGWASGRRFSVLQ